MKYFATLLISAVLFVACSGESSDPTAPDSNGKMSSSSVESGSNLVKSSSSITSGASSSSVPLWDVNVSSSYIESSNSLVNSSSSEQSSSSVTLATPCKTEMEDNCEYGELLDDRDGQIYKTVKIGDQVWMAENLNFKADSSCCYNSVDSNCTKYGRLYMWAAAVGKPESECGYDYTCSLPSGNIQGVCPSGWHLPSTTEWETLSNAVGEQFTAGGVLKSTLFIPVATARMLLGSRRFLQVTGTTLGNSPVRASARSFGILQSMLSATRMTCACATISTMRDYLT